MLKKYIDFIKKYFSGSTRSKKAKRNILYSFGIKGISIIIGLLFVPLLIDYLDKERYGVWLTISSIIMWFSFFDLGLGHGFRNKFAEAIAQNKTKLAKEYVSTVYSILSLIFLILFLIFVLFNSFLNWQKILNTNIISGNELSSIVLIVFFFFCLRFVLKLIGQILMADQRPAINNAFGPLGNLVSLILIYILIHISDKSSLFTLSLILSSIPVFILFLANLVFFKKKYKKYRPSIKFVNIHHSKPLFGLGIKFFFIQASVIIIYQSTNLLITQICSPKDVVVYNVAYKYFNLFTMLFTIILTPIWSATTEAFVLEDYEWIKRMMKTLRNTGFIFAIVLVIALFFSNTFYFFWLKGRVIVPFKLSAMIAVMSIMYVMFSPYIVFLNGVSKIKLNLILVLCQTGFYIPLAIFFGKYLNYGIIGILLAQLVVELPLRITQPMQYYKIINRKAKGIWNK